MANNRNERKSMNNKFDELTKSLAQSVTRRAALKKFGTGLAGMALACFGLANKAEAAKSCATNADCRSGEFCSSGVCVSALSACDICVYHCVNDPLGRQNKGWCKKVYCAAYCQ